MRFERRKFMVSRDLWQAAATLRQGEPQMAAGIYRTTVDTVHKSIAALMGWAVPVSALSCLFDFPLSGRVDGVDGSDGTRSL